MLSFGCVKLEFHTVVNCFQFKLGCNLTFGSGSWLQLNGNAYASSEKPFLLPEGLSLSVGFQSHHHTLIYYHKFSLSFFILKCFSGTMVKWGRGLVSNLGGVGFTEISLL